MDYAVAHVNHNTRKGESDRDEAFVKDYFKDVKVHVKQLNISKGANFHNEAHLARYAYFQSLGYDKILTAHHQDDQVETIFVNFLNGRSLNNITNHNKLIRPLLPFSKEEILAYALADKVRHIDDSSNHKAKYLRNLIRNKVLPLLNEKLDVKPRILGLSAKQLKERELLHELVDREFVIDSGLSFQKIPKSALIAQSPLFLQVALRKFGVNVSQCNDLLSCLDKTGSMIMTPTHKILVDREEVIIEALSGQPDAIEFNLDQLPQAFEFGKYRIEIEEHTGPRTRQSNCQFVPRALITGTLQLRTWQAGDSFQPLGMNGKSQTLKKFFVNQKVDRFSKDTTPILTHEGEIVLLLGLRNSEVYRVLDDHTELVKVTTTAR